jgi:hypothetical protein
MSIARPTPRPPDHPRLKVASGAMVDPFIVMEVLVAANARAAEGGDVIHMKVGEPGSGPPDAVLAAARRHWDGSRSAIPADCRCVPPSPSTTTTYMGSPSIPAKLW